MNNSPWECPRCGRINAPFNPFCVCKKQDKNLLEKINSAKQQIPMPMYPEHGWLTFCPICNGNHGQDRGCMTL